MTSKVYSLSPYTARAAPTIDCYFYRPAVAECRIDYPYDRASEVTPLQPTLHACGAGFSDGEAEVQFVARGGVVALGVERRSITVQHGRLEVAFTTQDSYPDADAVEWHIASESGQVVEGTSPLTWARFSGRVTFRDRIQRSACIVLVPVDFNAPGRITVPVNPQGQFDATVPARVYAVLNVNSGGYAYDTLERWAWDYDLTRDRIDNFTIGRTELYGMRAFDIKSPLSTIFILFRPSALSRLRQFAPDEPRLLNEAERRRCEEAMRSSATVIGPELSPENVTVWLNGEPQTIRQFDRIPEYDGEIWQVQYLVQIYPTPRPERGVWHEIKVQVESRERLHGREVLDFGEGSVGFCRD